MIVLYQIETAKRQNFSVFAMQNLMSQTKSNFVALMSERSKELAVSFQVSFCCRRQINEVSAVKFTLKLSSSESYPGFEPQ